MDPTAQGLSELFYKRPFRVFQKATAAAFATPTLLKLMSPTEGADMGLPSPVPGATSPDTFALEYRILKMQVALDVDTDVTLHNDVGGAAIWGPFTLPAGFGDLEWPLPGMRVGPGKPIYLVTSSFTGRIELTGVAVPPGNDY